MTTSPTNLTDLAKQGNPEAIATLMNRLLQPKGITAYVSSDFDRLQIRLESAQVPNQPALVKFVHSGLTNLRLESLSAVELSGYQTGEPIPAWTEKINLSELMDADEPFQSDSQEQDLVQERSASGQPLAVWKDKLLATVQTNPRTLALGAIAVLLGLGAVAYSVLKPEAPAPATVSSQSTAVVPAAAPTAPAATPAALTDSASPTATSDPFREAVNKAMQAATETQTATTLEEWRQVSELWQASITLLGEVPDEDANYAIAQQKVGEYQRNLSYAEQQVEVLIP